MGALCVGWCRSRHGLVQAGLLGPAPGAIVSTNDRSFSRRRPVSTKSPYRDALARDLARTGAGQVLLPGDDGYEAARRVWNGAIDRKPAVVARPGTAQQVGAAVRVAASAGLPLAVRGGGHSVAGFSTCDDGIVIDLSQMRGVQV